MRQKRTRPGTQMDCVKTADVVQKFLEQENAWWKWDGHKHLALLASGKLGDCYYNCTPLFYAHTLKAMIARAFYVMLKDETLKSGGIGGRHHGFFSYLCSENAWVVGSAYGAIWIAESFGSLLGVRSAFTEKAVRQAVYYGSKPMEHMELRRFDLGLKPYVILVEDVTTTGGTTRKTKKAIEEKHPDATFCPMIFTIINRSGAKNIAFVNELDTEYQQVPVKALIEVNPRTWESEADLPPEMNGCKGIRPKGNWKALTTERL